jgi:DNA repair protein RecO (recombination protein O)
MRTVNTEGIIYKLINYSDNSAIAIAFTKDFGKVKFFVSKAFTKKGSVWKFIPGTIKFYLKPDTDLHKFYSINQNIDYYYFLDTPDIYLRLHLIFEIYDILNEVEEPDEYLWKLILNFKEENLYKASIYTIYYIIKSAGLIFDVNSCSKCGKDFHYGKLSIGGLYCNDCYSDKFIAINKKNASIIKTLEKTDEFKNIFIDKKTELDILEILVKYIRVTEKVKIKGIDVLKSLSI